MLKYLILVELVWWCGTTAGEINGETDIQIDQLLPPKEHVFSNGSLQNADTPMVLQNNHTNYYVAQQIIYILGQQQFEKYIRPTRMLEMPKIRDDYVVTPGIGAHKLHRAYYSWNKARQICVEEGGHLAIINSDAEEDLLIKRLKANNLDSSWLGIHDLYEEGEWVTVLDQSLSSTGFMKWSTYWSNEPDGGTVQNCGTLTIHGGIDDGTCRLGYTFFCEIPIPIAD